MAGSFLRLVIGMVLLNGFQHGTSGSEEPEERQGVLWLHDGRVLTPYGLNHGISPQNRPVYSPAHVRYRYSPVRYHDIPRPVYYPNSLPPYQPLPPPKINFGRLLLLLIAFNGAFNPATTPATTTASTTFSGSALNPVTTPATTTTTTTTTASTAFPGTCVWGAWSDCSAICKGTRTRQRMCSGNNEMDSELCNTETGFVGGNWYRASNCYEYYWSLLNGFVGVRGEAEFECTNIRDSELASTGLRDDSVRTEIVTAFAVVDVRDTYVGISDASVAGTYVWSDGYEGDPTFWESGEPNPTGTECIFLKKGIPDGLYSESSCTDSDRFSYLCERPAQ